eukprot:TRINITY_DN15204_c0_g1_i1.p1 TRINITY_DN15204_c0_g1~~TRINITY_DN15204_c0_g1_i1.p1  ORF type:complete len:142 (+),score=16.17 TRINITY_DN15204_c0_g1_i1:167-592(+)
MCFLLAGELLVSRTLPRASCFRHVHEGPDTLEGLLERHVVKGAQGNAAHLTNTRREALHLYRYILRATCVFVWSNEHGVLWRDVLRTSARSEFEAARFERDPEVIAKLLVGGRDAVDSALQKFLAKREAMTNELPMEGRKR